MPFTDILILAALAALGWFGHKHQRKQESIKARYLYANTFGIMPQCKLCGALPDNHSFARLGGTIATKENESRLKNFWNAYKGHDWQAVSSYDEFEGRSDAVDVYAVKCPDSRVAMVWVRSPAELYEDSQAEAEEDISSDEVQRINSLIPEAEWKGVLEWRVGISKK